MNNNLHDKIMTLYFITTSAFASAFAICFNNEMKKQEINIMYTISEVILHGVCGVIVGMVSTRWFTDILMISAFAGVGGLIGEKLIFFIAKMFLAFVGNHNGMKVSMNDIDLGDDKPTTRKKRK